MRAHPVVQARGSAAALVATVLVVAASVGCTGGSGGGASGTSRPGSSASGAHVAPLVTAASIRPGGSASLTAVVTDSSGVPLGGIQVAFVTSGPGARVAPALATTNGGGQAQTTFTGTAPGAFTVTATVSGVATPATFVVTVRIPALEVSAASIVANASASPPPVASGFTAIRYTVTEPHDASVNVRVQVDTADGRGFRDATQAPNPPGAPFKTFAIEGTTDVAATSSGTTHVFLWDSGVDARGTTTDRAQLRITAQARGSVSPPATISNVKIRNGLSFGAVTHTAMPPGTSLPALASNAAQVLATADLDHDGDLDLVLLDATSNAVQIFKGSATGAFTAGPSVPLGAGANGPAAVAVGDVDGDGLLDVVVYDVGSNGVRVLLQGPVGTFRASNPVASGLPAPAAGSTLALALADLSGAGRLDIVLACSSSATLNVLANQGAGAFGQAVSPYPIALPSGTAPTGLAVADLDRDGRLDVVLSSSDGSVLVVAGRAVTAGTPNPVQRFATGKGTSAVAIGDVNGDGRLDIVAANKGSNDVSVLLATSAAGPTPSYAAAVNVAVGTSPTRLALADLDGDGRLDIVTANAGGGAGLTILTNATATGAALASFMPAPSTPPATGAGPVSLVVGDFDRDGALDVLTANASGNSVSLVRLVPRASRATALSAARRAVSGDAASQLRSVTLVDLNRDGKQDLVAVDQIAALIWVFLALGDGAFASPITISAANVPFHSVRDVVIADLDGDGILDLAFADALSHCLWVLLGEGDGTFARSAARARSFATGATFFPYGLVVADVDGDSKPDLVSLSSVGTELAVFRNASSIGAPNMIAAGAVTLTSAAGALAAGDLDRDGRTDIVLANPSNDSVTLLLSTTVKGAAATFTARSTSTGKRPAAVAVLDANGDGKLDVVVANAGDDDVAVLLGDGAGGFGAAVTFATGVAPGAIGVGDLDGDGHVDLVVGSTGEARETILLGDGRGNFVAKPSVTNPGGSTALSIAVGDLNGDGAADLVLATLGTGLPAVADASATSLLGDGSGAFGSRTMVLDSASPMPYLFCDRAPVVVTDINLDGFVDIVAGNLDGTVSVFTGSASGAFSPPTKVILGAVAVNGLAVFDVDGDGKPDIVAVAKGSPSDSVYVRLQIFDGTGAHYTWQPPIAANASSGFGSSIDMAVADVNGDGIPDLVIPNRYDATVSVLLGDGAGGFTFLGGSPLSLGPASPSGGGPTAVKVADVNHDGRPDLLVLDCTDDSVTVLLGPSFTTRTKYSVTPALPAGKLYARSLVVADLDRDGEVDFAFCEPGGFGVPGTVYVFRGDANGGFAQVAALAQPGPASLAVADVNDDGLPDLLVTSAVTSFATKPAPVLSFLVQEPAGSFSPASDPAPVVVGATPVSVTACDVDRDGRLDFIVANPGDGTVQIIYGR